MIITCSFSTEGEKNMRILDELRKDGVKRMILDTDTYNEIDDQFALALAMLAPDRIDLACVCAAPFHNPNSESYADGMERSYREIGICTEFVHQSHVIAEGVPVGVNVAEKIVAGDVVGAANGLKAMLAQKALTRRGIAVIEVGAVEKADVLQVLFHRGHKLGLADACALIAAHKREVAIGAVDADLVAEDGALV